MPEKPQHIITISLLLQSSSLMLHVHTEKAEQRAHRVLRNPQTYNFEAILNYY